MFKKLSIVVLFLFPIAFFVFEDKRFKDFRYKLTATSENLFYYMDSLSRENDLLIELNLKNNANLDDIEKLCRLKVEDGHNFPKVASGYACLADLYSQKDGDANIFRAIWNASFGLDVQYNEQRAAILAKMIFRGFEDKVPANYLKGDLSLEKEILTNSLLINDENLRRRIYYRLALIEQLGRNSALKERMLPRSYKTLVNYKNDAFNNLAVDIKNNIDIVFTITENYAKYAAATIASILVNADIDSSYSFHIISDKEFLQDTKDKLASMQNLGKYTIDFKVPEKDLIPFDMIDSKLGNRKYNKIVFYRLPINKLYPNLNKALYLDVDVIVKKDLADFYNKDIEDFTIAGILDPHNLIFTVNKENYKLCEFDKLFYINAGIMLMNLEKMNRDSSYEKMLELIKNTKCNLKMLDQDILNLTFSNETSFIANRWNSMQGVPIANDKPFASLVIQYGAAKDGINKADDWKNNNPILADIFKEFFLYKDLTPWKTLD